MKFIIVARFSLIRSRELCIKKILTSICSIIIYSFRHTFSRNLQHSYAMLLEEDGERNLRKSDEKVFILNLKTINFHKFIKSICTSTAHWVTSAMSEVMSSNPSAYIRWAESPTALIKSSRYIGWQDSSLSPRRLHDGTLFQRWALKNTSIWAWKSLIFYLSSTRINHRSILFWFTPPILFCFLPFGSKSIRVYFYKLKQISIGLNYSLRNLIL